MKYVILLAAALAFTAPVFAQNASTNSGGQVVTVQPKIMVIPRVKENEDIRTVIDNNGDLRIAIAKVKEAFDKRGFTTIDFVTSLKAAKEAGIFTADNQSDIKSQLMMMAGPDIYVETDIIINKANDNANSVTIILGANETTTGMALSNKSGESGQFRTNDIGNLAGKAVDAISEDFLNILQAKFTQIANDGKSIKVDISFAQGSAHNGDEEFPSLENPSNKIPLTDLMDEWMGKNAYKNNFTNGGSTKTRIIYSQVSIPLKDQATKRNYTPTNFALLIYNFLKSLGMQCGKDIKGGAIFITVK